MCYLSLEIKSYIVSKNSILFYIFHLIQDANYSFQLHTHCQIWSTINNQKIVTKILQRTNFNIINILVNILRLVVEIFMVLKFALCNILITDFFDYLLLIIFDNEFVTENSNLDLTLNKIYRMVY